MLKHGTGYEVLASNKIEDGVDASPALADGDIYLRSDQFLCCISEP